MPPACAGGSAAPRLKLARHPLALLLVGVLGLVGAACAGGDAETPASEPAAAAERERHAGPLGVEAALAFLRDRQVYLPQFAGGDDGSLYVVWRERAAEGRGGNLFIARRSEDGRFTDPVRVNDLDDSAGGGSLDEGRPGVVVGADGVVLIAFTDRESTIRMAVSHDYGASFAPSLALNSDAGTRAYRGFVDVAVDAAGVGHAAWIDGRFAPRGAEEPAELYYARVENGEVTEINLTEDQEDSICGCCRIGVDVRADDTLVIAFRNTGGGYRDIWRMEAGEEREFTAPARLGPPMWELNGCPVIGPINVGEATLWSEASTGKRRLLVATETGAGFDVVLEDNDSWAIERPPRLVAGAQESEPMLLVPGRPGGVLLRGSGLDWRVVAEELPRWGMSAALLDDNLVVIGDLDGEFHAETREIGG